MGEQLKLGAELQEGRDSDGNIWVVKGNEVLFKKSDESKYRFVGFLLDDSLITFRDKSVHLMRKNNTFGFNYSVIEGLNIQKLIVYEPQFVSSIIIREHNELIHIEQMGTFERQLFIPYDILEKNRVDVENEVPYSKQYSKLGKEWFHVLKGEFRKEYMIKLGRFLANRRIIARVFPESDDMFRAMKLTPYNNVKVVIVGQEPYHTEGIADGLAFSSKNELVIPPSLEKIYKGMEDDYDFGNFLSADASLEYLAEQGVLLLNRFLTVEKGNTMSHSTIGWKQFTDAIIRNLNKDKEHLVFLLWGSVAKDVRELITKESHFIIECEHPAFASREIRPWEHNKCFSKTNKFLEGTGQTGIRW